MSNLLKYDWSDRTAPWTEDDHQVAVASLLRRCGVVFAADQNAGRRSLRDGAKRKRMGMVAGEPDLRLSVGGGCVVYIEMKTAKGTLSAAQVARHDVLRAAGHFVHVCKAATPDEACAFMLDIIETYGLNQRTA